LTGLRKKSVSRAAFTLVEVVLALGVTSFVFVAVLGMISVGMSADQNANQSITLATMTLQVVEQMRGNTNWISQAGSDFSFSTNYYFDNQGTPSTQAAAYYACQLSTSNTNSPPVGNLSTNFAFAQLRFTWPASVKPAPVTNSIYASIRP